MPRRITLVEDDVDAAVVLQRILVKAGYNVQVLQEGSAIVEAGFDLPDMFILDNYMPTIHGLALCKFLKLKSHTANIPVIIISGEIQVGEKAEAAGASCFLSKPFVADQLLTVVEKAFTHCKDDLTIKGK